MSRSSWNSHFTSRNLPPDFALLPPSNERHTTIYCWQETLFAPDNSSHKDPVQCQPIPHFIAHRCLINSTALLLYREAPVPLWFYWDVCIYILQASYSQSEAGFFFGNVNCLQCNTADSKEVASFCYTPQQKLCEESEMFRQLPQASSTVLKFFWSIQTN